MRGPLGSMSLAACLVTMAVYLQGGTGLVRTGLEKAAGSLAGSALLLGTAFLVMGQFQELMSPEVVNRLIHRFAGWKGIVYGALLGGAFPGAPYVYYPFMATLRGRGIPLYLFLSLLSGKQVYDLARFPMEAGLIGPGLALLRMLITLPIPLLMGGAARWLFGDLLLDTLTQPAPGREA